MMDHDSLILAGIMLHPMIAVTAKDLNRIGSAGPNKETMIGQAGRRGQETQKPNLLRIFAGLLEAADDSCSIGLEDVELLFEFLH